MFRVICFDLDGTLCDSVESAMVARSKIFDYASERCKGLDSYKFQEAYDEIWEEVEKEYARMILELGIGEREIRLEHMRQVLHACGFYDSHLARELVNVYWEERRRALRLFPETLPVLSSLRRSYKLSLLTNGPSDWQREKINDLEIADFSDHIVIGGEVGYVKPNPAIFNILLTKYSIPASQILYVGDNQERDVFGAYYSGLNVAWLNRKNEESKPDTPKPHYEIRSLKDLLSIL